MRVSFPWYSTDAQCFANAIYTPPYAGSVGIAQVQNVNNLHEGKAVNAQNVRHTVVLIWLYELPFGRGKTWLKRNRRLCGGQMGGLSGPAVYVWAAVLTLLCHRYSRIPELYSFDRVPASDLKSQAYHQA